MTKTADKIIVRPAQAVVTLAPTIENPVVDLEAPIPKSREDCIDEISKSFMTALRYTTLNFWRIGRVIDSLQKREEEGVLEEVMQRTGYERRTVQYTLAVYRALPDANKVRDLCEKGTEWTHFKQLASLKNDSERRMLVDTIIEGDTKPIEIPDKVREFKEASKPKPTPASPDPCSLMEKFKDVSEAAISALSEKMMEYDNVMTLAADDSKTSDSAYKKFVGASEETRDSMLAAAHAYKTCADNIFRDVIDDDEESRE